MELQLLWYLLASFTLGFIVSTIWEWMHFRKKYTEQRDQRIAELEASLSQLYAENQESGSYVVYPEDILPTVNAQPENRAASVLLETEQVTRPLYE